MLKQRGFAPIILILIVILTLIGGYAITKPSLIPVKSPTSYLQSTSSSSFSLRAPSNNIDKSATCLPKDFLNPNCQVYSDIDKGYIKLSNKLNLLQASCNSSNKLTASSGKEIYFYSLGQGGAPMQDVYKNELEKLQRVYEVLIPNCSKVFQ